MAEEKRQNLFIKREPLLGDSFKSFRRSRSAITTWVRQSFEMKQASKKWHNSMEGKMFHRKLARFNMTKPKRISLFNQ
jgi:hypothetical protein